MNTMDHLARPRLALALSGGGFRASLFHLGVLRRLAELGWLERLDALSTVSGGSILGAFAALNWSALPERPTWPDLETVIVNPFLQRVQSTNFIRDWLFRLPLVPWRKLREPAFTRTSLAAELYSRRFYHNRTCSQLPARPYLVMNATALQTIRAWRFTRSGLGDSRSGHAAWGNHALPVGDCVGASAAFPPVFTPSRINRHHYSFGAAIYGESKLPDYPFIPLSDGGVYDNLGIEALQKDTALPGESQTLGVSQFVVISDAGYPPQHRFRSNGLPLLSELLLLYRVDDIAREQICAQRKRWIIRQFQDPNVPLKGILVSLASHVGKIPNQGGDEYYCNVGPQFRIPQELLDLIQRIRTNLDRFTPVECQALMYHAYTMTDAFLWTHRATCPEGYRVPEAPAPPWRIEFSAGVQREWRTALADSGKFRLFR